MAIIYQAFDHSDAHVRVHITKNKSSADLCVFSVSSMGMHKGDTCWFLTSNRSIATTRVFLCSAGMAQITVYFSSSIGEAAWQRPRPSSLGLK